MKKNTIIATILFAILAGTAGFFAYRYYAARRLRRNVIERTVAIIKPDAVRAKNTGKIIDRIEREGFIIVDIKKLQLDKEQAGQFYSEHQKKSFFGGLVDFMCSGPAVVLLLEKLNAIADWRDLMGAKSGKEGTEGTLRKEFGTDVRNNAVHGSDSQEAAGREVKFFFADRFKM